jgi:NAD(P)-dependent dehydrogenase (short-subunit alcohol dehydrogenase family)
VTTTLLTGANTGIGAATARELARRGHRVFFACRSEAKTRPVMEAIARETGNTDLHFLELHLDDLESVHACAAAFLQRGEPLHVLLLNAGVAWAAGATKQGFEPCFGVNHLGHFALTQALLGVLERSAPSRVVVVASRAHERVRKPLAEASLRRGPDSKSRWTEYADSKLANMLFARELARRVEGRGIAVYALHPGVIASQLWRSLPWPLRPLVTLFMKTEAQGAVSSVHCATAEGLQSSGYFGDAGEPRTPSALAQDDAAARALWAWSESWTPGNRPADPVSKPP